MWRPSASKKRGLFKAAASIKSGLLTAVPCLMAMLIPLGPASGEIIFLDGGGKLKGSIVQANGNIVVIQRPGGGIQQIVRSRIAEVSVDLEDGQKIVGDFGGWSNGVLLLDTDAGPVRIRSGHLLDGGDEPVETASLAETPLDLAVKSQTSTGKRSYVPPPILTLKSGATISGRPTAFETPRLTVRRASGGQQTLRVGDLKEIAVRSPDGGSIVGEFIDWSEGVFELLVDDQIVRVERGVVLNEAARDGSIGGPLEDLPKDEDDVTVVAGATEAEPPNDETAPIPLTVTNEPAIEHDAALLFNVSLARPTPKDLIIIYSTLPGTADQNDFTSGNGIAKINAGSDSGTIRIPLVDDEIEEGDESLSLFLSSDPKLVYMSSNTIAATIKDND